MKLAFLEDWREALIAVLATEGYPIDARDDLHQVAYTFASLMRRKVPMTPRDVFMAPSVQCPNELAASFELLKAKFSAGQDVNPHLSKGTASATAEDALLNDWGIHHFHLGSTITNGFTDRTGPLLFAVITNQAVHGIGIYAHGAWAKQEMLAIIHHNWPSLLAPFRIPGLALASSRSDDEISELRKGNVNSAIELGPGLLFRGRGGGIATDGSSTQAVMEADRQIDHIRDLEKLIHSKEAEIRQEIKAAGKAPADELHVKLFIEDGQLTMQEVQSGLVFAVE